MSSLIQLGFSVVIFIITYGILFLILPAVLSTFFSAFSPEGLSPEWEAMYNDTTNQIRFLVPLVPTIGIFIIVLKVLLSASTTGAD